MSQGSTSFSLFITQDNYALSTSLTRFVNTAKRFRLARPPETIQVLAPNKQGAMMAKNARIVFEANEVARLYQRKRRCLGSSKGFSIVRQKTKMCRAFIFT
jgi:hypothetical protein